MKREELLLDRPCKTEGPRFEQRDDGRFCHHCQEMQYDLRDATRAEVVALVKSKGGRVCGQLRLGPGGEPKFRPEPPPRALDVLRSAAVAMTLAACGSPPEASVAPEPVATTASPPPSEIAAPPTSVAEAPPTTVAEVPPPTTEVAAGDPSIDHSTDTSTDPADHQTHRHRHAPVAVGGPGELGELSHPSYGGGIAISQPLPEDYGSGTH